MVQIIGSYMQNTERVQFCKPTTMEVVVSEFGFHDFSIRHRPIQPTSFNSFVLHYVKKGKGIFKIEKKVYEISGGTFFMSPPGIQVTLIPDAEDPWCYYWMNCFGQEIPKLFNDAKLSVNNPLYVYPDKEEIEREFKTLFENTKNSWAPHHLFALASFLNIMGKITLSRSGFSFNHCNLIIRQTIPYHLLINITIIRFHGTKIVRFNCWKFYILIFISIPSKFINNFVFIIFQYKVFIC